MVGRHAETCGSECCDIFKALSVETRVRIIELLKTKGPLGPKKIAELLGVTPAAISQHLKTLRHVGLVRSERRGYWIPYEVDAGALEDCRVKIAQVCSCGCHEHNAIVVKRGSKQDLKSLQDYRRTLEGELRRVNKQIEQIKAHRKA